MEEIVGILASILILVSMIFKTDTDRQVLCLRVLNLVGSVLFVVYGFLIPAYSTAVVNFILVFVNLYYICLVIRRRNVQSQRKPDEKSDQDRV